MADKKVEIEVVTDEDLSGVQAIDKELHRLKAERLQLKIDAGTEQLNQVSAKLDETKARLEYLQQMRIQQHITFEDDEIKGVAAEVDALQSKKLELQIAVADDQLHKAKEEEEALNGSAKFNIDVDDSATQQAMQNINDGISQAKQGVGELASGFGEVLSAAGSADQNQAFLRIGFDKAGSKNAEKDAKEAQGKIQDIVAHAPGDDTAMNSILSSAVAKDVKLMDKDMQGFAMSISDYFAGAEVNGKHAAEAIQDVKSYINSGNVAELQTTGIFDDKQLDELKDIDSVTDRVAKFQEMMGKTTYDGLGDAPTLNNKFAEFDGMLAKSATTLGSFFTEGTKGAADLFLKFNDLTGGLAGMGLVAVQQFGPGIASIGQGLFTALPGMMQFSEKIGGLSGLTGMLSTKISGLPGILGTFGSALTGLGAGPIALIIAAIVGLGVAIYEVGKYFGWWKDLPTMFEAITAGVGQLWNAFMSNQYVIQAIDLIKQGLTDAWNAIVGFGQAIMTAIGGAGGQFDILGMAIQGLQMVLDAVGPLVILAIQGIIQYFRNIYTSAQIIWPYVAAAVQSAMNTASNIINTARSAFQGIISVWNTVSSAVSSMCSAIQGGLSAASSAWSSFSSAVVSAAQPILDVIAQIQSVGGDIWKVLNPGSGGIETPTVSSGSYGSGPTTVTQGNTIIFNMYGDVKDEKTIDDMINAINDRLKLEALANGVGNTNNESGAI